MENLFNYSLKVDQSFYQFVLNLIYFNCNCNNNLTHTVLNNMKMILLLCGSIHSCLVKKFYATHTYVPDKIVV